MLNIHVSEPKYGLHQPRVRAFRKACEKSVFTFCGFTQQTAFSRVKVLCLLHTPQQQQQQQWTQSGWKDTCKQITGDCLHVRDGAMDVVAVEHLVSSIS